ncbi:MAG: PEP-CTERM sorting domain-containing protein [Candidatus Omnitrophica bacterium]|nr:PEP-CTERM sorting domain-containing protein [Candidatus Omnitrophota bacterium]
MGKKCIFLFFVCAFICIATQAFAAVYSFTPTRADIYDLDHYRYYTWGINFAPPEGETILSASLAIDNINNWQPEANDRLYIHLFDNVQSGLTAYWDGQLGGDNFQYWTQENILLDVYTDLHDAPGPAEDYSYEFTQSDLAYLTQYAGNDGRIGFGFDADCHYWNDGVTFTVETETIPVPEPASVLLFGMSLIGMFGMKRRTK